MRKTNCPGLQWSRRQWLASAAGAYAATLPVFGQSSAPTAPVSIAKCPDYGAALTPTLKVMFDQLGGLSRIVRGKTVAIKINMTGSPTERLGNTPTEDAQYTHPALVGAVVRLIGEAGARRIRVVEGCFACPDPLPEFMMQTGWDPSRIFNAAPKLEMVNTNLLGVGYKQYARFKTPQGGHIFPGFDLHPVYQECDVLVSLAKMKEHATCGVTLSMKNMFGATPLTIYGDFAGKSEPDENGVRGGRGNIMHQGSREPAASAPPENDPKSPRDDKYRMPRIVADIAAARPIQLAIIDGIYTMSGGEGPWNGSQVRAIHPGVLVAGTNALCTDAIATAVMGFDPMAVRGTIPFESCDSSLLLAEQLGVGTRDPRKIEVVGVPVKDAVYQFRKS